MTMCYALDEMSANVASTSSRSRVRRIGGSAEMMSQRYLAAPRRRSRTATTPRSSAERPVLLKLENADQSATTEVLVNTTVADAFETLTWDFSNDPNFSLDVDYVRVVIFFDFGSVGDGATYLFDDVQFGAGE